ncbi:hypothetical protein BDZ97DRAFT_1832043 [Flammula alnicola]|nr:hypothetical protein BDZ97DRAFT_1832043 [Flammula alnicola]
MTFGMDDDAFRHVLSLERPYAEHALTRPILQTAMHLSAPRRRWLQERCVRQCQMAALAVRLEVLISMWDINIRMFELFTPKLQRTAHDFLPHSTHTTHICSIKVIPASPRAAPAWPVNSSSRPSNSLNQNSLAGYSWLQESQSTIFRTPRTPTTTSSIRRIWAHTLRMIISNRLSFDL